MKKQLLNIFYSMENENNKNKEIPLTTLNNFGVIWKKLTKAILKFWKCLYTYFFPGGMDISNSFFKYSTSIE